MAAGARDAPGETGRNGAWDGIGGPAAGFGAESEERKNVMILVTWSLFYFEKVFFS